MKRLFARADFVLLAVTLALTCFGSVMVASATRHVLTQMGTASSQKLAVHLVSVFLGLGLMALLMSVDYAKLLSLAPAAMGIVLLTLLGLLGLGHAIRGSTRWIPLGAVHLQPSEFAKLALVLMLAFYLSLRSEDSDLRGLPVFLRTLGLALAPGALILLQPDLGTPVVLFLIWVVVMYVVGARPVHLAATVLIALLLFGVAWQTNLLRPHQKERLAAFAHPERDPQGSGWHPLQSRIAVGSGHFWGKGLFRGSQSNLAFIPDQETDFIFAVVGEELGFVGSVVMLTLLGVVIVRCYAAAQEAKDVGGRVLAAGVGAWFSLQVVVNVGTVLGLMPVKGLSLPFISYGGSAMLVNLMALGVVQSVYMRRHKIVF